MTALLFIHNWDKWQSYRGDRGQPPWIKVHRSLLRERKWIHLTDEQRGQLLSIWLLAADEAGSIPNDPAFIKMVCCLRGEPDLNYFLEQGFLDATATPPRRQPDLLEKNREETEKIQIALRAVLDSERVSAVIEHRKKLKQPLTLLAARTLAKKLGQWKDANEAADEMVLRGWRGFNPEWMQSKNAAARKNGSGWYIKPDTAEWDAWRRYGTKHSVGDIIYGMKVAEEKGVEFQVKDRWPPK